MSVLETIRWEGGITVAPTDKETFQHVMGHLASGVTVLTTSNAGEDVGATASAVSSLSLEPPMLPVCLNRRSSTQEAIHGSGRFGVNIPAGCPHIRTAARAAKAERNGLTSS